MWSFILFQIVPLLIGLAVLFFLVLVLACVFAGIVADRLDDVSEHGPRFPEDTQ